MRRRKVNKSQRATCDIINWRLERAIIYFFFPPSTQKYLPGAQQRVEESKLQMHQTTDATMAVDTTTRYYNSHQYKSRCFSFGFLNLCFHSSHQHQILGGSISVHFASLLIYLRRSNRKEDTKQLWFANDSLR